MADTQIDGYEAESDPVNPTILYPIIASVFSAFCIISIAAFLLSNRKCCKKRKSDDPESALLKQRLVTEQKRMSKYNFKFPFERPLLSSVMQQEANDIAQEVKESYKTISTDISKPILCCPNKKVNYIYNPKSDEPEKKCPKPDINSLNPDDSESNTNTECKPHINVDHIGSDSPASQRDFDIDSLNGNLHESCKTSPMELTIHCDEMLIDSLEKKAFNPKLNSPNNTIPLKFFTESEIENAVDLKSLFFKKWIKNSNEEKLRENESDHHDYKIEQDMSYDDIESILTSVSRMDSYRMQKLKDSNFYKNLITQMEWNEILEVESVDKVITSKTGNIDYRNLTHEEIMQVAASPSTQKLRKSDDASISDLKKIQSKSKNILTNQIVNEDDRNAKDISDRKIIQKILNSKIENGSLGNHGNTVQTYEVSKQNLPKVAQPKDNLDETVHTSSEIFKSSIRPNALSDFTESVLTNETNSRKTTLSESLYSDSLTERDSTSNGSSPKSSRPKSLDLKRKHTELNIDVSFTDDELDSTTTHSTTFANNEYDTYKEQNSISSSCSSRGSSITTWQEINKCNKDNRDKINLEEHKINKHRVSSYATRTGNDSIVLNSSSDSLGRVHPNRYRTRKRYKSPKQYMTYKQKSEIQTTSSNSLLISDSDISLRLDTSVDPSTMSRNTTTSKTNTVESKSPKKLIPSRSLPKFVTGNRKMKKQTNKPSIIDTKTSSKKRYKEVT